tara:strand:- start:1431 stop:2126 length:696 start_codon:yes stop_codon:yes gene_type:complete
MQKYYVETQLGESKFDNKDLSCLVLIAALVMFSAMLFFRESKNVNIKIIEPYYQERFAKVPSKKVRFSNAKYDTAISKILLDDHLRRLRYKFKDLNHSLTSFQSDLLKQQAMNDMILMLRKVKSGDLNGFDIGKMQQAVLEAGYGNVDKKLLEKALKDYQQKVAHEQTLRMKLEEEKRRTQAKMEKDSKDAAILAKDIAREIAEEEIEGFIENLSIIARVGHFVIQKVSEE